MSFVQPESSPAGRTLGIGIAVAFHLALVWALASGLGRQVMQAIHAPIETVLIEEVKPPPPPPKVIELPPPKFAAPPPAYVPPPEVQVQAPPPQQPAITATVAEAPPPAAEPMRAAPPAPAAAPAAPAAPAPTSAAVVCSNYSQVMSEALFPREAMRLGIEEGSTVIQFTLAANGEVKDIKALAATHAAFAKASMKIVGEYRCKGTGRDVTVQVPFSYRSG